jgi:hypothetical protein
VHHGVRQKEYVFWKYQILENLVSREPQESIWNNPKRDLHEVSWYFHTKSFQKFGELHRYFYRNGVKILPKSIFDVITPRMIAVWFMDDGSNNGANLTINTHGFSKEEQMRVVDFLRDRYSIPATIVKDRTKHKLAIGRNGYQKFIQIVEPFIIPAMSYKIVYPRNDLPRILGQSEEVGSLLLC